MPRRQKVVFTHTRAPGDIVVMTAAVRDFALAYPGEYEINFAGSAKDLWRHNPHLTEFEFDARLDKKTGKPTHPTPGVEYVQLDYGRGIYEHKHVTRHFLSQFHLDVEKKFADPTGPFKRRIEVPVRFPHPDLHLSPEEAGVRPIASRYWVILSGGKSDFTTKVWAQNRFQTVSDRLQDAGLGVVQIGSTDSGHSHPELRGALNLIGQTNLRDMMRLIYHADGVICGVTCAMHMAAALHRPCVVLAGGREAWWWEAYVRCNVGLGGEAVAAKLPTPHRFLHTIGRLDCCKYYGCWKNKVTLQEGDKSVCHQPVFPLPADGPTKQIPKCLDMISADMVVEACMSYYTDRSLPPLHTGPAPEAPLPPERHERPKLPAVIQKPPTVEVALTSTLEGRKKQEVDKPQLDGPLQSMLDSPHVGGKVTIFILFYGPEQYYPLHQRCLSTLLATVPRERRDLRVGSNELNPKSLAMIQQAVAGGDVRKHYRHRENAKKYPVMREMFWDPECPIETQWVIWFDDDTICDKDVHWLDRMSHIMADPEATSIGDRRIFQFQLSQMEWIKSRPWYKDRGFQLYNGNAPNPENPNEVSNANKAVFAPGGFWAIRTDMIRKADIPDTEIQHNGGDYMIGAQVWQAGGNLRQFNSKKRFVTTSSVPRRGLNEPHTGTREWEKAFKRPS